MIERLTTEFRKYERDINVLVAVLTLLLLIIVGRAIVFIYERDFEGLWTLLLPATPVIAAILVARVAGRLIVNEQITRENQRRQDVVRVSHHLIAVTKDLKARVSFVAGALERGTPMLAISEISDSIKDRYEALLERESYNHIPGSCVDIITNISGCIYGIGLLSAGAKQVAVANPVKGLGRNSDRRFVDQVPQLNQLVLDLETLLNELFELRDSVDLPAKDRRP